MVLLTTSCYLSHTDFVELYHFYNLPVSYIVALSLLRIGKIPTKTSSLNGHFASGFHGVSKRSNAYSLECRVNAHTLHPTREVLCMIHSAWSSLVGNSFQCPLEGHKGIGGVSKILIFSIISGFLVFLLQLLLS